MTKQQLIERVAQRLGKNQQNSSELHKKTVALLVDTVFAELGDYFIKAKVAPRTKKAPRFTYPGFGTFTKKEKAARAGVDPRSGEAIEIPARTTLAFAPGQEMKAGLNRPKAKAARRG
jgi:nucleoid DNA-binding protein